ncbi:MAG: hypothetical protein ACI892_002130 [Marinobacter maritimus]
MRIFLIVSDIVIDFFAVHLHSGKVCVGFF